MSWMLAGQLSVAFMVGVVAGVVLSLATDRRYSGMDPVLKLFTVAVLTSYCAGAAFALIMTVAFR